LSASPAGRALQLAALTSFLAGVGLLSMERKLSVLGADLGWHLKTGDWILQHRGFPHTGIFSGTAATRPWIAYSWGYEVLLSRSFAWLGLVGMALFGTALTLLVAFTIFWMTERLSGRFWLALALAAAGCESILLLRIVPRPAFFSIALFCLVLTRLFQAQRERSVQRLYCLPLVFLLWANLHIQFVYGVAAVALLLAANVTRQLMARMNLAPDYLAPTGLASTPLAVIFVFCVLATIVGPYSYHLYGVIFRYSQARVPYEMVQELQPFRLRLPGNYVQLLLAIAAFAAIGFRKQLDLFKLLLLALATVFAYRTMRDAWFQVTVAVACLADVARAHREAEQRRSPLQFAGVFAAVALLLFLAAPRAGFNEPALERALAGMFPVDAVHYLQQNPSPGPLWNIFDWGGFLAWYLPQYPVSIDPRTDLYGDQVLGRFHRTENGAADYRDDPYLNDAGVALLRARSPLAERLRDDPRFRQAYADRIATLFVRRQPLVP
jgi:hypothetical protein